VGQEECPLSLIEEYRCLDQQRDNKQRNMPLLTINNERIEQRNILRKEGQINMEGMMRRYSQEEEERLLKEITENNETIIKLQKQIGELQIVVKEEGKRKEREVEARRQEKEEEETDK